MSSRAGFRLPEKGGRMRLRRENRASRFRKGRALSRPLVCSLLFAVVLAAQTAAQSTPPRPPSSVFLPNGEKLYSLDVPGARERNVGGRTVRVVEIRGWLRQVAPTCLAKDPAWYYLLEPDLAWTDSMGISLTDLVRVGNITGLADGRGPSAFEVVGRPLIRIEFGGWDARKQAGPPPSDWRYRGAAGCPDVSFSFNPLRPVVSGPLLTPGRYVRVVGSLVSDAPHATKATIGVWLFRNFGVSVDPRHPVITAQKIWSEGREDNPDNPARWTEIHPPDEIEPLPDREPSETIRGVALCLRCGLLQGASEPVSLELSPPGPRPAWASGIHVTEHVLAVSPNVTFGRSVAISRVTTEGNFARIRIDPGSAAVNKFAAVYRVSWSRGRPSWSVVKPAPRRSR